MDNKEKTKKVRVRGTGCYNPETQEFDFAPFGEGETTQRNVKTCRGGGKAWTTTGADPSRMITLKCKESSPDQYADLLSQFNALTKGLKPGQEKPMPDTQRLVNENGLQVWLDARKAELTVTTALDLGSHYRNWQAELLRQVQLVVRRLPAASQFNKVINDIKTQGGK